MTLARITHALGGTTPVVARIKTTKRKVKTSIVLIKSSLTVRTSILTPITLSSNPSFKYSSRNQEMAVIKI